MKKVRIMSLLLGCLAVLSLASCNDDDGYTPMSKEEKAQCYQAVRGLYDGKLVYATGETKNGKTVTDTLGITWRIDTDSTLTVRSFPSRVLAVYVTNSEVKKALEEAPSQDLPCRISFVQRQPVGFLINPAVLTFNLNYGGADHKVQVEFYNNVNQSYGMLNSTGKQLYLQILEGSLYIDGKRSSDLKNGSAFALFAPKA